MKKQIVKYSHRMNARMVTLNLVPIAVMVFLVWSSCKDAINDPKPSDVVFPDSGISYSKHVETLFSQSCATANCHGGSAPANNLNLERPSYLALTNHQPALVHNGDPDNSLLVWWIDGTKQPRMPNKLQPLTDNQIKGIRRWIKEGAINN
ncbi:MAG: hypothetical protein HY966_04890 [Ignavibacteriales bacterium]|nr:hypothetical protein [Ignavibacteriales bacterium]